MGAYARFAESEAGLAQLLAWFARLPWPRTGLVVVAVAAVLYGGARLWTSGPDAVHITIAHVTVENWPRRTLTRVAFDRTIRNRATAQRLQRELAAMPLVSGGLFQTISCPDAYSNAEVGAYYFDTYALTWYRAGLPVEHASADRTWTGCTIWQDDAVFLHSARNVQAFFADIDAALTASG